MAEPDETAFVEKRVVQLKSLNPFITCYICKGYLIDATTVTECLHTFCKSCLIRHLDECNTCPKCEQLIHQSHPKNYISYDRSVQDVVYKLVPNLYQEEMKRREAFYASRGMKFDGHIETTFIGRGSSAAVPALNGGVNGVCTTAALASCAAATTAGSAAAGDGAVELPAAALEGSSQDTSTVKQEAAASCYRSDEQVNLWLRSFVPDNLGELHKAFVRCSTQATVTHLKKLVAKKLFSDISRYREIDILCNGELMGRDHTLKFIQRTRWRIGTDPLELHYRFTIFNDF